MTIQNLPAALRVARYAHELGDNIDALRAMPDACIDAIVTDPPYGLSFLGKAWDHGVPAGEVWEQCLRVLKPGGHLLAFGGTRTYHRMACAVEDAGFEIRDCVMWVYSQGFPKSLDVSKAIDKAAGAEREVVGTRKRHGGGSPVSGSMAGPLGTASELPFTAPATDAARQWSGWGTALKPAVEPVVVARKPLDGTVAHNVLTHGTGAINVDGCRVDKDDGFDMVDAPDPHRGGRWPANLIHDGSEEVLELFPQTKNGASEYQRDGDSGSAARFFYCAKASKRERGEGNTHPTVKPVALMRYLVRLVTQPGGVVLDPFMGSGTTGVAAIAEGMRFVGLERSEEYHAIAVARLAAAEPDGPEVEAQTDLFGAR